MEEPFLIGGCVHLTHLVLLALATCGYHRPRGLSVRIFRDRLFPDVLETTSESLLTQVGWTGEESKQTNMKVRFHPL